MKEKTITIPEKLFDNLLGYTQGCVDASIPQEPLKEVIREAEAYKKKEKYCGELIVTVWCPVCDEQTDRVFDTLEDGIKFGQCPWSCRCMPGVNRAEGRYQIRSKPIGSDDFYWKGDQWESPIP